MLRELIRLATSLTWLAFSVPAFAATGDLDFFSSHEEGVARYMQMVEHNHLNKNHMSVSVYELIRTGNFHQALTEVKYVLDRIPNHPRALQVLTLVSQLIKNSTVGISYFEKAVTIYPQYALTHAQYGLFLVTMGDVDAGIEKLIRSTEMDAKLPAGHVWLAQAYAKKGDITKARESAAMARQLGFTGTLPDGL